MLCIAFAETEKSDKYEKLRKMYILIKNQRCHSFWEDTLHTMRNLYLLID